MTDKETLLALLDKINVNPAEGFEEGIVAIAVGGSGPNVNGYTGFFTLFHFDEAGNLLEIGVWE